MPILSQPLRARGLVPTGFLPPSSPSLEGTLLEPEVQAALEAFPEAPQIPPPGVGSQALDIGLSTIGGLLQGNPGALFQSILQTRQRIEEIKQANREMQAEAQQTKAEKTISAVGGAAERRRLEKQESTRNALAELRAAISAGNLQVAQERLDALERQVELQEKRFREVEAPTSAARSEFLKAQAGKMRGSTGAAPKPGKESPQSKLVQEQIKGIAKQITAGNAPQAEVLGEGGTPGTLRTKQEVMDYLNGLVDLNVQDEKEKVRLKQNILNEINAAFAKFPTQ